MKNLSRGLAALVAIAFVALACAAAPAIAAQGANTLNYMEQGGSIWDVGGTLNFNAGGVLAADKGSATANAGNSYAVTVNKMAGIITTDSLTTAAAGNQVIVVTDSEVTASSMIQATWAGGTNTAGTPVIKAVPSANTVTITIYNKHASAAFAGTFVLHYLVA